MCLLNKILFIHKNLNTAFSQFLLNDRILDWYEVNPNNYFEIKQDLVFISTALKKDSLLTLAKLFDERDNKSISVQQICKNINSVRNNKNKEIDKKIKTVSNQIIDIINNNQDMLNKLITWRDKYLAHFDKQIMNNPNLIYQAKVDFKKLLIMVKNIYDKFNEIIYNFKSKKISLTYDVYNNSIDTLFFRYLVGLDVLYNSNQNVDKFYKKINFPISKK